MNQLPHVNPLSRQISAPTASVRTRRVNLGIDVYRTTERSLSVQIDESLAAKIDTLAPLVAAKFRSLGLPVRELERWQVIEFAINQLTEAAKHDKTRSLYIVGPQANSKA